MPIHAPEHDALEFARRLKEAMDAANIPSGRGAGAYLSRKYGVTTVTANAWLNGTHMPTPERVRQIAEDLGCSYSQLYFGNKGVSDEEKVVYQLPASAPSPTLDADELKLLAHYRRCSAEARRLVSTVAASSARIFPVGK